MVDEWNRLSSGVVRANTIDTFKNRIHTLKDRVVDRWCWVISFAGAVTWRLTGLLQTPYSFSCS